MPPASKRKPAARRPAIKTADGKVLDPSVLTEWRLWTPDLFATIKDGYHDDSLDLLVKAVAARKATLAKVTGSTDSGSLDALVTSYRPPMDTFDLQRAFGTRTIKVGTVLTVKQPCGISPKYLQGLTFKVTQYVKGNKSIGCVWTEESAQRIASFDPNSKWLRARGLRMPATLIDGSKVPA